MIKWLLVGIVTIMVVGTADAGIFRRRCCCATTAVVPQAPPPKVVVPKVEPPKPMPATKEAPKTAAAPTPTVSVVVNNTAGGRLMNFVGQPVRRILRGGQCGLFGCR